MKNRYLGLIVFVAVIATVFVAAGTYAGTTVSDNVQMKAPYEHKKGIVTFSHQKHVTDYKIGCGDCHHDDKGQPLTNLKAGDDVKNCFECHNKPGELKGKKAKGLSKAEKRAYHANALHENCIDCHKGYNKKNKTKAAPTKCTACHPKEK
jgi:hypothetical protein